MSARIKRRPTSRLGKVPSPYKSRFEYDTALELQRLGVGFGYETHSYLYFDPVPNGVCRDCDGEDVGTYRWYTPDFDLKNGNFIECKGKLDVMTRKKLVNVMESNNDINLENFRLLFLLDNWMTKTHTRRYTDWAREAGIQASVWPHIPEEWLEGSYA